MFEKHDLGIIIPNESEEEQWLGAGGDIFNCVF